jgi:HlyD family type I secretion membrane fusion protein
MMDKNESPHLPTVQNQLPSIEVVTHDEGPPSFSTMSTIKVGVTIVGCFVLGVILWIVLVPMGTAITAPGEVVFLGKRQSIQHLEGGIIKTIFVKDGEVVKVGQPLIELEQSQVQPIVQMLEQQDAAEIAQTARLEAESKGLSQIAFPPTLVAHSNNPEIHKVMQNENRLFIARRAAHGNQVQLIRLQISQLRETIKGMEESLAAKRQEIGTVKEQLAANQALQRDGYVARSVVLDLQRLLSEKTGQKDSMAASLASERQRIHELEQRIASLNSERVQVTMNELKQSVSRRIDLQERIRPVKDTLERQVIKSPVLGKVVGLKVTTIGGVIMPRETLMEIAPLSDQLIVEAKIRVEDVNEVSVGQKAEVRVSGLDARTIPALKAEVTYISADRIIPAPAQGQQPPYFAATLKLDQDFMKKVGDVKLMPGMTASVAIAAKPRSAYSYLIEPLFARSRKAIHAK